VLFPPQARAPYKHGDLTKDLSSQAELPVRETVQARLVVHTEDAQASWVRAAPWPRRHQDVCESSMRCPAARPQGRHFEARDCCPQRVMVWRIPYCVIITSLKYATFADYRGGHAGYANGRPSAGLLLHPSLIAAACKASPPSCTHRSAVTRIAPSALDGAAVRCRDRPRLIVRHVWFGSRSRSVKAALQRGRSLKMRWNSPAVS